MCTPQKSALKLRLKEQLSKVFYLPYYLPSYFKLLKVESLRRIFDQLKLLYVFTFGYDRKKIEFHP